MTFLRQGYGLLLCSNQSLSSYVAAFVMYTASGLAIVSIALILQGQQSIKDAPGACAFSDGENYCRMAEGQPGRVPFSRRPLVPFIVRLTDGLGTTQSRFFMINLAGAILATGSVWYLASRVVLKAGRTPREAQRIGLTAAAFYALAPFSFRLVAIAPILTDPLATGLVSLWLATAQSLRRAAQTAGPMVAGLAVLARETSVLPIILTAMMVVALKVRPWRDVRLSIATALTAFVIDFSLPNSPSSYTAISHFHAVVQNWLQNNPYQIPRTWFMGVGFGILALSPFALRRIFSYLPQPSLLVYLLPAAGVSLVVSLFGGFDHGRIASAAMPTLCVLAAIYLFSLAPIIQIAFVSAILVTLSSWQVLSLIVPARSGYINYFYARGLVTPLQAVLLVLTFSLVLILDGVCRLQSSESASSNSKKDDGPD